MANERLRIVTGCQSSEEKIALGSAARITALGPERLMSDSQLFCAATLSPLLATSEPGFPPLYKEDKNCTSSPGVFVKINKIMRMNNLVLCVAHGSYLESSSYYCIPSLL